VAARTANAPGDNGGESAVCSAGVSHDDLRGLVPAYAAGTLDPAQADAVRAHLTAGCASCLTEVFRRPVGLPRAVEGVPVPRRSARASGLAAAAVTVLALGVVAFAGWTLGEFRRQREAARVDADRLTERLVEDGAARGVLAARVERLARDVEAARAEASAQAETARSNAEASAALQDQLDAAAARIDALTRGLRRREGQVDRLRADVGEGRAVRDLLGTPGAQLVALGAVAPFRDVRGHVLWHPGQDEVLLYAFQLPPLPDGTRYHVRVTLDDGRVEEGPSFRPGDGGRATQRVRLGGASSPLREIRVLLDPAGQPVLAGRVLPPED
jgi:hypothetical protein